MMRSNIMWPCVTCWTISRYYQVVGVLVAVDTVLILPIVMCVRQDVFKKRPVICGMNSGPSRQRITIGHMVQSGFTCRCLTKNLTFSTTPPVWGRAIFISEPVYLIHFQFFKSNESLRSWFLLFLKRSVRNAATSSCSINPDLSLDGKLVRLVLMYRLDSLSQILNGD